MLIQFIKGIQAHEQEMLKKLSNRKKDCRLDLTRTNNTKVRLFDIHQKCLVKRRTLSFVDIVWKVSRLVLFLSYLYMTKSSDTEKLIAFQVAGKLCEMKNNQWGRPPHSIWSTTKLNKRRRFTTAFLRPPITSIYLITVIMYIKDLKYACAVHSMLVCDIQNHF